MPKKNEYIIVRRFEVVSECFDWEEFEETVRAYMNMGYELVGGISITSHIGGILVAQSLVYKSEQTQSTGLR